jgi:hypothetical protein
LVSTGNDDQSGFPIDFTDGFIIERRGDTPVDLTFVGHVKLTPTQVEADAPYTYLSRVYPTGSTLGNSGIGDTVVTGAADVATNVWLTTDTPGSYELGYFADPVAFLGITEGWKLVSTGNDDAGDVPLTAGIIVQRNQDAYTLTLTPPPFYADL